eukprot:CAMPEP_0113491560 /NCGR_PEP_ID=MMETSP0014_2-20120614/27617_1 /TAXON_ID=2857 /ORGANISM="Nitzschia sp." /LENGTH=1109 /DNA_ID=CAMNT_0000385351 /DNA_START=11 /DNA_END=3336 /DNA_ORIENTATION=+ /assembly_acc=CAM_ASM_000159
MTILSTRRVAVAALFIQLSLSSSTSTTATAFVIPTGPSYPTTTTTTRRQTGVSRSSVLSAYSSLGPENDENNPPPQQVPYTPSTPPPRQRPPPLATTPSSGLHDQLSSLSSSNGRLAQTASASLAADIFGQRTEPVETTTPQPQQAQPAQPSAASTEEANGDGVWQNAGKPPPLATTPNSGLQDQLRGLSSEFARPANTEGAAVAASVVSPSAYSTDSTSAGNNSSSKKMAQSPLALTPHDGLHNQLTNLSSKYGRIAPTYAASVAASLITPPAMREQQKQQQIQQDQQEKVEQAMQQLQQQQNQQQASSPKKAAFGVDEPFEYAQLQSFSEQNPAAASSKTASRKVDRKYTPPPLSQTFDQTRPLMKKLTTDSIFPAQTAAAETARGAVNLDVPFEYKQQLSPPQQNPGNVRTVRKARVAASPPEAPPQPEKQNPAAAFTVDEPFVYAQVQSRPEQNPGAAVAKTGQQGVDRNYTPPPLYAAHDQTRLPMKKITPDAIFPGQTAAAAAKAPNLDVPFQYKQTALSQPQVNPAKAKAAPQQAVPPQQQTSKPVFLVDEPFQYKQTLTTPEQNPADSRPAGLPRTQTIQTTTRHVPPPLTPMDNNDYFQPKLTKIPIDALQSSAKPQQVQPGLDVPFQYKQTAMSTPQVNPAKAVTPIRKNPKLPAEVAHAARAAVTTREASAEGGYGQVQPGLNEPPPAKKLTTPIKNVENPNVTSPPPVDKEVGLRPGLHQPPPSNKATVFYSSDFQPADESEQAKTGGMEPGLYERSTKETVFYSSGSTAPADESEQEKTGGMEPGLYEPATKDTVFYSSDTAAPAGEGEPEKTGGIEPGLHAPTKKDTVYFSSDFAPADERAQAQSGGMRPGLHEPTSPGTRVFSRGALPGPGEAPLDNPSGVIQVGVSGKEVRRTKAAPPAVNAPPPSISKNKSEGLVSPVDDPRPSSPRSNATADGKGSQPSASVPAANTASNPPKGTLPEVPLERPSGVIPLGGPAMATKTRKVVATSNMDAAPAAAAVPTPKPKTSSGVPPNGMKLDSKSVKAGQDDYLTGTETTKSKRPLVFFHDTKKMVGEAKEEPVTKPVDYPQHVDEPSSSSPTGTTVRKPTEFSDDV